MQIFYMMRILAKKKLQPEAEKAFEELVVAVENSAAVIAPKSKVARSILINWNLNSEELREWYLACGIKKSASTIRSETQFLSKILLQIYMTPDVMLEAFLGNDLMVLKQIRRRSFVLLNAGLTYDDFGIDIYSFARTYQNEIKENDEEENAAIDFLNIIKNAKIEQSSNHINSAVVADILKVLTAPLVTMKEYDVIDDNGKKKRITKAEVNEEKIELIIKMEQRNRKTSEYSMPAQRKALGGGVYKEELLPFKDFLTMKEITDILLEYASCKNPTREDFACSGKTLAKAEQLLLFYTNPRAVLNKVNPFDLAAVLEQHKR